MKNWILPGAIWLAALAAGILFLADYQTTAGARGDTQQRWPTGSVLPRVAGRPTIVVFVHPKCICSRATATELTEIMADTRHDATVDVVLIEPANAEPGWSGAGPWESFKRIARSSVVTDRGGVEAKRFGAKTSGFTVVYDAKGRLLFSGGITGARGHVGDNEGRQLVLEQLMRASTAARTHDVFGCGLGGA